MSLTAHDVAVVLYAIAAVVGWRAQALPGRA